MNGRPTAGTKWLCHHCSKSLSSKRSYGEHMNIHNKTRPFACDSCDYAAGNHVSRQAWGYSCPHCGEAYMEPASYQQHVMARHFGRSATLGCRACNFTTKCSRQFQQHLLKHVNVIGVHSNGSFGGQTRGPGVGKRARVEMTTQELSTYLVDDELGSGYGKVPVYRIASRPLERQRGSGLDRTVAEPLFKFAKKLALDGDFFKTPLATAPAAQRLQANKTVIIATSANNTHPTGHPLVHPEDALIDWVVDDEVVIDCCDDEMMGSSASGGAPPGGKLTLPSGYVDVELD